MKKIALILALLSVMAFVMIGCSYESTDIQLISEHALFSTTIHLTEEEVTMLLEFLNGAEWRDGVYVLENDYKISLSNVTLDYRSGADGGFQAILNDMNKQKHLRLTEEQRAFIDSLIISDMDSLVSQIKTWETTYHDLCSIIGHIFRKDLKPRHMIRRGFCYLIYRAFWDLHDGHALIIL